MLLNTAWKKSIIPYIVQNIFTGFTNKEFLTNLDGIIRSLNTLHNTPDNNGVLFKGIHYTPYKIEGRMSAHKISEYDAIFPAFNDLIEKKNQYEADHKRFTTYITNGLVLCMTIFDLELLFPQTVLDAINKAHREMGNNVPHLSANPNCTHPRINAFRQKYVEMENDLAKHVFRNFLKPGN